MNGKKQEKYIEPNYGDGDIDKRTWEERINEDTISIEQKARKWEGWGSYE